MAHIVFIVGSYHPKFQAVGLCARNVINELKKDYQITIISKKNEITEPDIEVFEGTQIIRITNKINNIILNVLHKSNKSSLSLWFYSRILFNAIRAYHYIDAIFSSAVIQKGLVRSYLNCLNMLHSQNKIKMIIPCSAPFESCLASLEFVENTPENILMVPYMFDNYASNPAIYRTSIIFYNRRFKNHLKLERKLYDKSDKILCMKHYTQSFLKNHNLLEKLIIVEHPLILQNRNNYLYKFDHSKINIIYTGGLFKKIRSPKYTITIFEQIIKNNEKIALHFFGSGDGFEYITKFALKFPTQVFNHGYVLNEITYGAQSCCDFLLSIGNTSNSQLPSKTFEYMATLKPIIHFAKIEDDNTIEILEKYPNKCIIFEKNNSISQNVNAVNQFFSSSVNEITFSDLKSSFYDAIPEYTANKIKKLLN